jgi:hypothetical protein
MTPDRVEAAAVHCLLLADALDKGTATGKQHVETAALLCNVPLPHPLRSHEDHVLAMAEAVRRAEVTAEGLRTFVADLRKGAAEMRQTGWGWMVGGAK